jgi:hypothetical protein
MDQLNGDMKAAPSADAGLVNATGLESAGTLAKPQHQPPAEASRQMLTIKSYRFGLPFWKEP